MISRKLLNPDLSTRKIVIRHDSGMYSSYTPSQAAQMINELKRQLWSGLPLSNKDLRK